MFKAIMDTQTPESKKKGLWAERRSQGWSVTKARQRKERKRSSAGGLPSLWYPEAWDSSPFLLTRPELLLRSINDPFLDGSFWLHSLSVRCPEENKEMRVSWYLRLTSIHLRTYSPFGIPGSVTKLRRSEAAEAKTMMRNKNLDDTLPRYTGTVTSKS